MLPLLCAAGAGAGAACTGEARPELVLYAASSLRDALQELAPLCEAESGARVLLNLGSSGDLARQIVAAGQADLFFSAGEEELRLVEEAGLIEPGTRRRLLTNQLVVIVPAWSAPEPFELERLAGPGIERLSLAETRAVPAGRYARAWLEAAGLWERVEPNVLPGVDVRAALAAVESGAAQAGIVYRTDAAHSSKVRVAYAVPRADAPPIAYSLAVLAARRHSGRTRQLAEFLASERALEVFARHGFAAP